MGQPKDIIHSTRVKYFTLLILLCIYPGYPFFKHLTDRAALEETFNKSMEPTMLTPKSKDDEIISLNNIDALFFGSHGQILQPERTEKKLENTKLAVDIEAVFLSQNPQKRAVVIKGKKNELLRIGDQLESGIIIDEIRSNVIILRRGDVLERLPIRDEFSGETGAPAESNSRSPMLLSKEAFDIKQRLDGLDQRLEGL